MEKLDRYAPYALALLRIAAALIFLEHGTQKLFGFPAPPEGGLPAVGSLMWIGAWMEFAGGLLLLVGLFTFVTPEYNRSIPGALKNAIDWASRPYGENAFTRKPSAVIGASPGQIGTAVGQQSLRAVLGFCNAPQMTSPEAYIHFTPGLVDDDGRVTVASTAEFLRNYMSEFALFIQRVTTVLPRE